MAVHQEKRKATMILDGKQPARTIKELARDVKILNNHINKLDTSSNEFKSAAKKMRELKTELRDANSQTRLLNKNSRTFGQTFKSTMMGVVGGNFLTQGFQALLSTIPKLIQKNAELADSYADIQKTTNLTLTEVKQLDGYFKSYDTRTPRKELRELAVEAGRLGIRGTEDILGFVKAADKIKVSLGDDLGGAAADNIRIIGKLTEQYKVAERENVSLEKAMLKTGSAINELSASGSTQAEYLINFTKRVSGVTNEADILIDKVLGYAATLDEAGQNVEVSGTTISKAITKMFTDTADFAAIAGVSLKDFEEILSNDANEAFKLFLKGIQGNNEGLRQMATKLEDAELSGARATGVLASLANNLDKLEDKQTIANKALVEGTSLTEEFNKKNDNLAGTLNKIGKKLAAAWTNGKIREGITWMINGVGELFGIHQKESVALDKVHTKMNAMLEVIKDLNVEDASRVRLIRDLNSQYGDYLPNLLDEKANIEEVTRVQKLSNDALLESIRLKVQEELMAEEALKVKKLQTQVDRRRLKIKEDEEKLNKAGKWSMRKEGGLLDPEIDKQKEALKKYEAALKSAQSQYLEFVATITGKTTVQETDWSSRTNWPDNAYTQNSTEENENDDSDYTYTPENKDLERAIENFRKFRQTIIDEHRKLSQEKMTEEAAELDRIAAHYEKQMEMLNSFYQQKVMSYQEYQALKKELEAMKEEEELIVQEEALAKQIEKDQAEALKMEADLQKKKDFQAEIDFMQLDAREQEIEAANRKYDDLIAQAELYGLDTVALEELRAAEIDSINEYYANEAILREQQKAQAIQDIYKNLYNAVLNFVGAFAEEEGAFAEFQKGLAFFEVGVNQAKALAKALANSQSPTADNVATGGLAGLAKFAAISAAILNTAAAAKKYIFSPPKAPKATLLGSGGLLDGPLHSQGGMDVMSSGVKVMELEGNEGVFSRATMTNNPEVTAQLLKSSTSYGGASISQIPEFNYSGMSSAARGISSGSTSNENDKAARMMIQAANLMIEAAQSIPGTIEAYLIYEHLEKEVLKNRKRSAKTRLGKVGRTLIKSNHITAGVYANERLDTEL